MDAPNINVSTQVSDTGGVFTVIGSGFTPNSTVHIRVVDDALRTKFFDQSADENGELNFQQPIDCNADFTLHFSANDGRPNPEDITGTLWSNTFDIPCP